MHKDEKNFKLIRDFNRSEFYNELLVYEYDGLIKKNSFINGNLHINTVYLTENNYEYEAGIYITNNSDKKIILKDLPIILKSDNKVLKEKVLSIEKNISSYEAIFIEAKIDKKEFNENIDVKSSWIELGNTNLLSIYEYIEIKFEGVDKVREISGHSQMKKFVKNLPLIGKGNLALDIFTTEKNEDGFYVIILFRNTSNIDININSIPFEIYTENNLLIYKESFISSKEGIRVPKYTGLFKVIVIPENQLPLISRESFDNCKIIIK